MKPRPGDPLRAVAYLRVSTDAERQAHGLDVQRRAIEAWAQRAGVVVVGWFQDELSGTTKMERRAGLGGALGALRPERAGLLVVHRIDRLARDAGEGAAIERVIERSGARLALAEGGGTSGTADDPGAKLVRQVTLAAAEFEGAIIRARIRATKASMKARGLYGGGRPPYGWRLEGGALLPEPAEQAALAQLRAWRAGGASWRALARLATEAGLTNRAGRPWPHNHLLRMLGRSDAA